MNSIRFSWVKLKGRPLNTGLAIVLFAIGVAIISILISFEKAIQSNYKDNLAGVNLVVGAKGSPLQLILSSVLHADAPTGNISMDEALLLNKHPLVRKTIPLALGDNYKGYRIVGTDFDYAKLYNAKLASGEWFLKPLQVTLGAEIAKETGLSVGDEFSGVHGFLEGGHSHNEIKYEVVGIMQRNGSVLDRLILTPIKSVWLVHGHNCDAHQHETHEHDVEHVETKSLQEKVEEGLELTPDEFAAYQNNKKKTAVGEGHEITALLVFYKSPLGAVQLPRYINETTNMQAASPALELNRLLRLMGYGLDAFMLLAWLIIIISGINCFIHIWNTLQASLNEIALLRALGTNRVKVVLVLIFQSLIISMAGWFLGMVFSKTILLVFANISGVMGLEVFVLTLKELMLLVYCIGIGILATFLPAIYAYKRDVHFILSKL